MATPAVESIVPMTPPSYNNMRTTPSPMDTTSSSSTTTSSPVTPTRPHNPAEDDIARLPPTAAPLPMKRSDSLSLEPLSPTTASRGARAGPAFDSAGGMVTRVFSQCDDDDDDGIDGEEEMNSDCTDEGRSTTSTILMSEVTRNDSSSGSTCRTSSSNTDLSSSHPRKSNDVSTPSNSTASSSTNGKVFTYDETLFIIDWDDTLLPSTWLARNKLRLDDDSVVNSEQRQQLDVMATSARRILEESAAHGTVVIVTNAEKGWIELSCQKFMPSLYSLVSNIRILSARSTFEPLGYSSPLEWKIQAFEQVVDDYYTRRPAHARKNVLSFGDSSHEREAIMEVTSSLNLCRTKSIKFVERPDIVQLLREHELLLNCFGQVVAHDAALDLCVQCQ